MCKQQVFPDPIACVDSYSGDVDSSVLNAEENQGYSHKLQQPKIISTFSTSFQLLGGDVIHILP